MLRFVALACLAAVCAAQIEDKNAKILKEQRFNAGDGRAGAAFATENEIIFKEETDNAGNRIGQYSYIGDDGKTYTVRYSAGQDGFRILDGSHVPSGGQDAAAYVADPDADLDYVEEPLPASRPAPRRPAPQPAPQPQPQFINNPQPQQFAQAIPQQQKEINPFINPHDPTHRNFQFNKNAVEFDPTNPLAKQLSLVPPCAGCEGVNPFVNPFDETHNSQAILAGHRAGLGVVPEQRSRPAPRPAPRPVAPVQPSAPLRPRVTPTQAPRSFFPPGQLSLNRFETGFNFDFES